MVYLNYDDYSEAFLFRKELVYWYADNIFDIDISYHYYSNHTWIIWYSSTGMKI